MSSGVLNYFADLEDRPHRAHCGWCNKTTDTMTKRNGSRGKEFFDARVEVAGLHDKTRVCSSECANLWRSWARNRLLTLNAAFPAEAR